MIDVDRLRGIIAERGLSQRKVAQFIGVSEKTFYDKMKKGVFDSLEMSAMITVLGIDKPAEIFFASHVAR